jgi:exosortase
MSPAAKASDHTGSLGGRFDHTMTRFKDKYAVSLASPWLFLLLWISSLAVFWRPVKALVTLSLSDELYSHLILIPLISIVIIYMDRRSIFEKRRYSSGSGPPLFVCAAIVCWIAKPWSATTGGNDQLWLSVSAIVLVWLASFVFLNGARSFKAAIFPLSFLLLMIPVPTYALHQAVVALQKGSAEVTYLLFKVLGIPVFRHGFQFSLPGVDIEIAEQCSGIRSSLALLITGMLAAQIFLRSAWSKLCLILFTLPVAIFKNAVRIVTLSYLGVYKDRAFLDGQLHHRGGALFALVGLAILMLLLLLLQKSENRLQE